MSGRRKPRLLVLNQYYWPGVEATAQLLTELCEALAEDLDVKVVTGQLHGQEQQPHRTPAEGGLESARSIHRWPDTGGRVIHVLD